MHRANTTIRADPVITFPNRFFKTASAFFTVNGNVVFRAVKSRTNPHPPSVH